MAYIEKIPVDEATGLLARVFDTAIKRSGKVWQILHLQSLGPAMLKGGVELYLAVMFGDSPLSRAQREAIAAATSRFNGCHY